MPNQGSYLKALAFLLIGAVLGWQGNLAFSASPNAAEETDTSVVTNEDLDLTLFWNVRDLIQQSYVDLEAVDAQAQIYGAITGVVDSLGDPYSVYMNPEETQEFNSSLNGELEGIGAELTVEEGRLVIVSPIKDSPAEAAGILPGDEIYLIDGEFANEYTLWEAIMKIRGPEGTQVTLTLLREGEAEPLEKTITRQEISVPSLELAYSEVDGQTIAHLSLYQFGDDTYTEFKQATQQIILDDPDALILDLRMNGGGYLDISVEILSEFFEEMQTAVIVKYRDRPNEVIKTTGDGQLTDIPMVVLIDEGSASASEIVAGALQDYERATLIGEQSFGKGSVQELDELSDGSTLRLTVAKWYTPLDRSISEVGITPDIEVSNEGTDPETDVQLDAAIDYLLSL